MKILFAGDGNIDYQMTGLYSLPQVDREVLCTGFTAAVGGSTTIAAGAYANLGGGAAFCGLLGADANGRLLERLLRDAGVDLELARFTRDCATGVTVNLVHGSTRTQVTYPGTLPIVDETETILRELHRFGHIHIAGVYTLDRFLPRITEVLAHAAREGVSSSLDTQWDSTEEWRHLSEWLPSLTYLFVNEDEAVSMTRKASVEEAYDELADRTASPVIKRGPRGAFAAGRRFPAFPVQVKDPTGAGDSFAAGFLYATKEKAMEFEDAVRFGCAAGAVCCTFEGGVSAELTFERAMRLFA